jgi:hypothetical protein
MLLAHDSAQLTGDADAWLARAARNGAARRELTATLYMRERWTEPDVLALPTGEHNYFERKRWAFLDGGREKLAKALSALANSGGGHLVIGVQDDGTIDGAPPMRGRTSTRDWLEQIIPGCLAPPLAGFRVHVVERAEHGSVIPADRVVLVVDVADSAHAPHQAEQERIYYYREGGRSERAPHFVLEGLRNRLVAPQLVPTLRAPVLRSRTQRDGRHWVTLGLPIAVRNDGKIAALKWRVVIEEAILGNRNTLEGHIEHRRKGIEVGDRTLFPGDVQSYEKWEFDFVLNAPLDSPAAVVEDLRRVFAPDATITVRIPSEVSRGEAHALRFSSVVNLHALAAEILK